jgi:putative transposase
VHGAAARPLQRVRNSGRWDLAHLRGHRLRHQVLPRRQDHPVDEAERVLGLDDLRDDRGELELVDENTGEVIDVVTAPIAVVSDNGSCFRGETYQSALAGDEPLRHVRTRVRSPQTNSVIERFFGTLKYEHLYRAPIDDGGALAMETARFRDIHNRIRPHQALDDRTPRQAYLDT